MRRQRTWRVRRTGVAMATGQQALGSGLPAPPAMGDDESIGAG